jgi:hypothetical protein
MSDFDLWGFRFSPARFPFLSDGRFPESASLETTPAGGGAELLRLSASLRGSDPQESVGVPAEGRGEGNFQSHAHLFRNRVSLKSAEKKSSFFDFRQLHFTSDFNVLKDRVQLKSEKVRDFR